MNAQREMSLVEWCNELISNHRVNKELNLIREAFKLIVDEYLNLEEMGMHKTLVNEAMEVLKRTTEQANEPEQQLTSGSGTDQA